MITAVDASNRLPQLSIALAKKFYDCRWHRPARGIAD